MRIAFFEIDDWEQHFLRRRLKGHALRFYREPLDSDNLDEVSDIEALSPFIYSRIDRPAIERLPELKLVTTRSTGFDHVDLRECHRRGIAVCTVPSYGENTVAEHTFALILSISRKTCAACLKRRAGDYSINGLKGFDLKGRTLGVVGTGRIGLHVVRIAKGFGMNVLAYDVGQNLLLAEVLGFTYVPLDQLLAESDIVTLHVPYNEHTHHLLNRDTIKLMKKGTILINTSRGGLVDTEALIEALDTKRVAAAGLDVLEGEELIREEKQLLYERDRLEVLANLVKGHILLSKDNVIYTPHVAFYSQEALKRILQTTVENVEGFLSGNPQNVVSA
jgi:D-lactate dehydrogenase